MANAKALLAGGEQAEEPPGGHDHICTAIDEGPCRRLEVCSIRARGRDLLRRPARTPDLRLQVRLLPVPRREHWVDRDESDHAPESRRPVQRRLPRGRRRAGGTPSGVRTGRHPGNGEHERVEPCSSAAIALFTSSAAQRNSVRRPNQRSSCSYRRPRPRSRRRRSRSGRCAGGPGRAGSGRGRRSTASGFAPQAQLVCPSSRSSSSRTTSIATDALGYPT